MIPTRLGRTGAVAIAVIGVVATATPAGARTATPRCTTNMLSLSHTRHDVGAGNGVEDIVFTNTSETTCVLGGFPGVAYVANSGAQLGAAADREGSSHGSVVLVPGGKAKARLHFINNVGAVPGCYHPSQQAHAVGERVYPPGSTLAMFLKDSHYACKSSKVHVLRIESVRAA
jgi:hypothetical protein